MNNLHLIHERLVHIQLFESSAEPCCSQLENDFLFIGHHHDVYLYNCQNHDFSFQDSKRIQDLDAADDIIALEYIKETQTLIIVITNGFIVSCHDFPIGKFILKSQIEGGCHQARWSPNLSLIAIVKDEGRIFIIDSYGLQNEPLATIDIHKDQKSEYESKSVGWGKRDTQFRGQGMRLDPSNSQASQGSQIADYSDSDINQIKVSWRYDSKYFAVSYFSETYGRRLGVWSPDGVLYAMVKDQPGLYSVLSWAPTGYWITTAFKNEASYEIINYERNCLKRCSFKLDFVDPNDKIIDIKWNSSSDILAVHLKGLAKSKVQLYTMANFYWYLKYECELPMFFHYFDFVQPLKLMFINTNHIWFFKFQNTFDSFENISLEICSSIVIDGTYLYYTPFGKSNIPPPMCLCSAKLDFIPSTICNTSDIDQTVSILTLKTVLDPAVVIAFDRTLKNAVEPKNTRGFSTKNYKLQFEPNVLTKKFTRFRELRYLKPNSFVSLGYDYETDRDLIFEMIIDHLTSCIIVKQVHVSQLVFCLNVHSPDVFFQALDASIYKLNIETKQIKKLDLQLPIVDQLELTRTPDIETVIRYNEGLYIGLQRILDYCSQIFMTNSYIFVIHKGCKIICIRQDLLKQDKLKDLHFIERDIEKGSTIVAAIPSLSQIVLQATRGNIEVIYPRTLVVYNFYRKLECRCFKECLMLLRRHRVNLNILVDHDPNVLKNINEFVSDIEDPKLLIELLNELTIEDSTLTIFKEFYDNERVSMWHSNKMETVCTKIREECIRINENKFTLVIILTYLKQGPEFVESALKYIQSLNIEDPVNKEAALKFLHLYINPDILYKKALMTYDLELALMTAQITSKDPKEYIAYLEKLESLEVPYRHFIIEKDLKNYLIALKHLINCGVEHEQECVEFIKTRDLCKEALDLIPKHSEKLYKTVGRMYAERLGATNKKQSAIVYFSLGDYLNAFQIYCECGSYEESIMCFKKLTDIDTCVQEKLLRVLLNALIRNGHYLKASQVAEIYFDIEESIDILIEGRLWLQAFDLTTEKAEKFNRFKIELFERSDYFLQFFENQTQQISLKKARLLKVREEKAKRIFASNFGFESETSSVTSFSSTGSESVLITGSTTTSTKMRKSKKKQNSKYYRLKPDGPYEDFALMNVFFKLFEGSNKHISEAEDISNVLNMLGEWQRSRKLCSKMNTFKEFMSQTFHQIWTPNQHLGPFSTCQMYEDFILEEGTIDNLPILSLPDYETFKINHDLI